MKRLLFFTGLLLFFTSITIELLNLKPLTPTNDGIEIKAIPLTKALPEPTRVVLEPMPVIEPPKPKAAPEAPKAVGTCADWMTEAGITDWDNAIWLINKESGCNPNAVNPYSGACGIAQELPCGKSGCGLGNPVCQLKWMQNYVNNRYGGWGGAVAFHHSHNWY